ncbi:HAD-like domain-containing protein [Desarmillaria tabescens]|uniref:HAD-like domain-containing protein n=1 Tax=Armillaria tabescens TaxID=1929756 RepID=A0AA39N2Y7_ARMTA|nr:HAD-like domain-containing protein [Desarmillaria tabescens]KAK0455568.1 HAD-like domain-containing protein [Desarmillaria tabescens]
MVKIEYVLFDMDGLMIDSEKIYTDVTNAILAPYGCEMTWDIKAGCMGKPERAAAEHLLSHFPGISLTLESYLTQRNTLQDAMWPTVPLLPGVRKLVLHLKKHKIPMAVATGSRRRNYELKTGHLQEIFRCFDGRVVCADDERWVMKGKPEPDIFLVAAREMLHRNVGEARSEISETHEAERRKGLVFEDGLPGMQAGKRAGMNVIWIPDANLLDVEYVGEEKADAMLKSIEDFVPEEWGLPPYDTEA